MCITADDIAQGVFEEQEFTVDKETLVVRRKETLKHI